jgi:hypothetical protein
VPPGVVTWTLTVVPVVPAGETAVIDVEEIDGHTGGGSWPELHGGAADEPGAGDGDRGARMPLVCAVGLSDVTVGAP